METKQYLLIYWAISVVFMGLFLLIVWKKIKYQLGPQIMMVKGMMPAKMKKPLMIIFGVVPVVLALCPIVFPLTIIGIIKKLFKSLLPGKKTKKTGIKVESEKISEEINIDFNIDEK